MSKRLQDYYKKLLSSGFIYVEFLKRDGSLRRMWCTRDNRIIKECGHEIVQFGSGDLLRRENSLGKYLFVYDIQEDDVRMLNVGTINDKSIEMFTDLSIADIPRIKQRYEILAEERGVSIESLKNKKELDNQILEESKVIKERELAENLLESDLFGIDNDEDIIW